MEQLQKLSNELTLRTVAFNTMISKAAESKANFDVYNYCENLHKLSNMSQDYAECLENTLNKLIETMERFEAYMNGTRGDY